MSDSIPAIREALTAGLNATALDLARGALTTADPVAAPELHYVAALASARMGAITEAEKWLARIEPSSDSAAGSAVVAPALAIEVRSLEGRIAKERFATAHDRNSPQAHAFAQAAIGSYRRAFELGGAAYPAVNAATLALLTGDSPLATELATRALAALTAPRDHWEHASAGEASLLLGRIDEARGHYAEAHRLAGNRFGDIASMRHQLLLIGSPAALALLDAVPAPRVVAFSGHMIDRPDREMPRFPPTLEAAVAAALRVRIDALGPAIGYAQAACGADILFLEAMHAAKMQTQIVLPFATPDFIETSVRFAGEGWVRRFERVLAAATRVVIATEETFRGDDVLFEHAANLIQGMAFLRAKELASLPLMLTVLDRDAVGRVGGTAATADTWTQKGGRVENIDLAALRNAHTSASTPAGDVTATSRSPSATVPALAPRRETKIEPPPPAHRRALQSLLFADVSGFSKMPEQYAPAFAETFLGRCKQILDGIANPPLHANTHGDGLFLVFALPSHAADFAVQLQRSLGEVDWTTLGLAPETGVRIALHTGPLFRIFDPVTDRFTYYGTHVTRTARLEPVVQPRHIFTTEEFASSLIAEDQERYQCDYIGAMKLAKHYGEARLYRLRWTSAG